MKPSADYAPEPLGWLGIMRMGLVQASFGAVVVLATGTLNRLMVVEAGLPALIPGLLIAWHYLIQILRPRLGHGSDQGGRRTPWIVGGVAVLALGGFGAASATLMMVKHPWLAVALAVIDYSFIGIGVGCAGTSLLVLLAQRTAPERRPAAATVVWIMMIVGFVITAGVAGHALDPFSPARLLEVVGTVCVCALLTTVLAMWGLEPKSAPGTATVLPKQEEAAATAPASAGFLAALREVWHEPQARRFSLFVFVAMLAYSAQELLLDPFSGVVYGYTPGASTRLSSVQHGGALLGMVLVAVLGTRFKARGWGAPRHCTIAGCLASALMLGLIAFAAAAHLSWSLRALVFALGIANGGFAVSAIASMMQMVGEGARSREGVRMGLWGAAQAVAFAVGGLLATGLSDIARHLWADAGLAYAIVFSCQAGLFIIAAWLASQMWRRTSGAQPAGGAHSDASRIAARSLQHEPI